MNLYKIFGIIGLTLLIIGILVKSEKREMRNKIYIIGGAFLLLYSLYIRDTIFIFLQIIFIFVSIYDLHKMKN
ncbi:hypothetical protein CXT76_00570 [Candidatus Parvarchaeota archaeon]|jgi:lipid-A-disaccharide synthase-like uncharacterized protein|nr:MAG: hypothetical protein CXT76_00570 [Candidatus Parvarchaeota archaeon]HIG51976.1 hypothetical protein [Candidatus Pacearchaeota archaeon]